MSYTIDRSQLYGVPTYSRPDFNYCPCCGASLKQYYRYSPVPQYNYPTAVMGSVIGGNIAKGYNNLWDSKADNLAEPPAQVKYGSGGAGGGSSTDQYCGDGYKVD